MDKQNCVSCPSKQPKNYDYIKRLSLYEQVEYFGKLIMEHYPYGTTTDELAADPHQPYKDKRSVKKILEQMVVMDIIERVPLSSTANVKGVNVLYILRADWKPSVCPTCHKPVI